AQERLLRTSKHVHIDRTLATAQDRAKRDHQQLVEVVQNGIASARVFQILPTGNKLIQGILPTCFLRWQVESIASESVKRRLVCQVSLSTERDVATREN